MPRTFKTFLSLYAIAVLLYIVLNFLWRSVVGYSFYESRLGHLFGADNWIASAAVGLVFVAGLTFFAAYPAVTARGTVGTALALGGLFGLFMYATHNLINLATLKGWSLSATIIDSGWGILFGAAVAAMTVLVYDYLVNKTPHAPSL